MDAAAQGPALYLRARSRGPPALQARQRLRALSLRPLAAANAAMAQSAPGPPRSQGIKALDVMVAGAPAPGE